MLHDGFLGPVARRLALEISSPIGVTAALAASPTLLSSCRSFDCLAPRLAALRSATLEDAITFSLFHSSWLSGEQLTKTEAALAALPATLCTFSSETAQLHPACWTAGRRAPRSTAQSVRSQAHDLELAAHQRHAHHRWQLRRQLLRLCGTRFSCYTRYTQCIHGADTLPWLLLGLLRTLHSTHSANGNSGDALSKSNCSVCLVCSARRTQQRCARRMHVIARHREGGARRPPRRPPAS